MLVLSGQAQLASRSLLPQSPSGLGPAASHLPAGRSAALPPPRCSRDPSCARRPECCPARGIVAIAASTSAHPGSLGELGRKAQSPAEHGARPLPPTLAAPPARTLPASRPPGLWSAQSQLQPRGRAPGPRAAWDWLWYIQQGRQLRQRRQAPCNPEVRPCFRWRVWDEWLSTGLP